jgi:hypothetical protein
MKIIISLKNNYYMENLNYSFNSLYSYYLEALFILLVISIYIFIVQHLKNL